MKNQSSRVPAAFGLLLAVTLAGLPAGASAFDIRPIRVHLESAADIGVVTLHNRGDLPVVIQAQAVSWGQIDGRSDYRDTRDLVVSPPMFELEAGGRQVVRIGLRGVPEPSREAAYRIFFTEVPRPRRSGSGLTMNLSLAIPVFLAPRSPEARSLEWAFEVAGENEIRVRARNPGNIHVQVKKILLENGAGQVGEIAGAGYLLAGRERQWTIGLESDGAAGLKVTAVTSRGREIFEAAVAGR